MEIRQSEEEVDCVVMENDVSGVYWFLIISTEIIFLTVCQVIFDGSSNVASQLRGFELRQLSTGGTQSSYGIETLDQMAING